MHSELLADNYMPPAHPMQIPCTRSQIVTRGMLILLYISLLLRACLCLRLQMAMAVRRLPAGDASQSECGLRLYLARKRSLVDVRHESQLSARPLAVITATTKGPGPQQPSFFRGLRHFNSLWRVINGKSQSSIRPS